MAKAFGSILKSSLDVTFGGLATHEFSFDFEQAFGGATWFNDAATELVVPKGVTLIEVFFYANASSSPGATADPRYQIRKNGTIIGTRLNDNDTFPSCGWRSGPLVVSENDRFTVEVYQFGLAASTTYDKDYLQFGAVALERDGAVFSPISADVAITAAYAAMDFTPTLDTKSTHNGTTGFVVPADAGFAIVTGGSFYTAADATDVKSRILVDGNIVSEYSDNNSTRSNTPAFYGCIPVTSGQVITMEWGGGNAGTLDASFTHIGIEWISPRPFTYVSDFTTIAPNLTPVGSWGTIRRNSNYFGPILRVEDDGNPGSVKDIYADADGKIRADLPFGTNTRVVILYDQFGTSDVFADRSDDVWVVKGDGVSYDTWRLDFQGVDGMLTTDVTNGSQPWELASMVWACGFERNQPQGGSFRGIWGINGSSQTTVGLSQTNSADDNALFWGLDGMGGTQTWSGTAWQSDAGNVQGVVNRTVADMTQADGNAYAYYNGSLVDTFAYTAPLTYIAGRPLNIGDARGQEYRGWFTELTIFNHSGAVTAQEITDISEALNDVSGQIQADIAVGNQRVHAILGGAVSGYSTQNQRVHAVMGAPTDGVSGSTQRVHAVLGASVTGLSSSTQRMHAIIVP